MCVDLRLCTVKSTWDLCQFLMSCTWLHCNKSGQPNLSFDWLDDWGHCICEDFLITALWPMYCKCLDSDTICKCEILLNPERTVNMCRILFLNGTWSDINDLTLKVRLLFGTKIIKLKLQLTITIYLKT